MRLATLTFLALTCVGCASRSRSAAGLDPAARKAVLLTRNDLAPGRHCEIVDAKVPLPSIATVLDTAAMPDYLRQAGVGADTGYVLFSVRFGPTGKPAIARLIEATLPDSLRGPMEQVMASALLDRGPGAPLLARVRVDLGPPPVYRIGKSEYCPAVAEPSAPAPAPVGPGGVANATALRAPEKINYQVDLSANGDVEAVRFVTAVDVEREQGLRAWLMGQHYKPAIDDGLRVSSSLNSSVVIEMAVVARPAVH